MVTVTTVQWWYANEQEDGKVGTCDRVVTDARSTEGSSWSTRAHSSMLACLVLKGYLCFSVFSLFLFETEKRLFDESIKHTEQ